MQAIISGNQNTTLLLNNLKKSVKQYPSLNKQQERDLIEQYKDDRVTLNKLLFMHNIKLVFNMAKKYTTKTNDFDGLVQDGMIGLGEAAKRFDITKDVKFCTYAYIWIKKYMTMNFYGKQIEVDKRSTSMNVISSHSAIKSNNGNAVELEDYINSYIDPTCQQKSIEDTLSSNEQIDICKNLINNLIEDNSLSTVQKNIFVDMFYNKEKPSQLSEKYGVSLKEIATVKNTILNKFKNILQEQYSIDSYSDLS